MEDLKKLVSDAQVMLRKAQAQSRASRTSAQRRPETEMTDPIAVQVVMQEWQGLCTIPHLSDEDRLAQMAAGAEDMANKAAFLRALAQQVDHHSTEQAVVRRAAAAKAMAKSHADVPGLGLVRRGSAPEIKKQLEERQLEERVRSLAKVQENEERAVVQLENELNKRAALAGPGGLQSESLRELAGTIELRKGTALAAAANTHAASEALERLRGAE